MELQKILQKANNINTKEEKLTFLLENIWQTMYDGLDKCVLETSNLRCLAIEYIKTSFDAENVETNFDELAGEENGYYDPYEGVKLNICNFLIGENSLEDMSTFTKFLITTSHEFTHHNDMSSNKNNNIKSDSRFSNGYGYSGCLKALGKLCNNSDYGSLGYALYFKSNNETLARKISCNFVKGFAKQLRKITNEKLPAREQAISRTDELKKLLNENYDINVAMDRTGYTNRDYITKELHDALDEIESNVNKYQQKEDDFSLACNVYSAKHLRAAKNDFYTLCNKYISGNYNKDEMNIFNPNDMAIIISKPEFFNKELGENLYDKILHDNTLPNGLAIVALGELSCVNEINIPKKDRQQHLENYEEYQKFIAKLDNERNK